MAVHQNEPRRWTGAEVSLILEVANRCWEALERARVTRVLEESEERFRTLADNIAQLAWMAEASGWIFWYNRRWFEYTGTTLEQMQGWGWSRVHHPEHIQRVMEKWNARLAAGEGWEDTFPLRRMDGEYRWFLSRAVPIRDAQGKVLRWFGTNTDVTEQRAAAEALARAKDEAEAANRAKDDFLATLSHELRTPLTPVLLSAAAMQEDEQLPVDARAQLAMMRRNIELEARLIDDLLDLTRISRGKLTVRMQQCEVHALMQLALEIVRTEAEAKGLVLRLQLKATLTRFDGDPARIQQVFWNLLKNAVKFTAPGGTITISLAQSWRLDCSGGRRYRHRHRALTPSAAFSCRSSRPGSRTITASADSAWGSRSRKRSSKCTAV
jgi:PAS domain S-box-containing protein